MIANVYLKFRSYKLQNDQERTSLPEAFCKRDVLRNFANFRRKHLCQSLFFNKVETCNFIKKETLVQVFCCEFCEISKNTFSYRTTLVAASAGRQRTNFFQEKHDRFSKNEYQMFIMLEATHEIY